MVQHGTVHRQRSGGQRGSAPHRSLRGLRRVNLHRPPRRVFATQDGGRGNQRSQRGHPVPFHPPIVRILRRAVNEEERSAIDPHITLHSALSAMALPASVPDGNACYETGSRRPLVPCGAEDRK